MKIMFILCLLFAQQTVVASIYGLRAKPTYQEKIGAILGDNIKSQRLLSDATKHLIIEGELIPPALESGPLPGTISGSHSIEDWAQLLEIKTITSALTEVSANRSHIEEARRILIEQHGAKHGKEHFSRLLSLLLVKKGIDESAGGSDQKQRVDRVLISNVMVFLATAKALVVPYREGSQPSVSERDDVFATKDDLEKLKDEILKEIKAHTTN